MRKTILCVVGVCIVCCPALVFPQDIYVFDDVYQSGSVIGEPPGLWEAHFFAYRGGAAGLTAVQFMAPIPDCWQGTTYLGEIWSLPAVTGDLRTGITLGFGECRSSDFVYLGCATFLSNALPSDCCKYEVLPDPASVTGMVELVDCEDAIHTVYSGRFLGIGSANSQVEISNIYPADGATGVSLDPELSWEITTCCPIYLTHDTFAFGTTPDLTTIDMDVGTSYRPGPLAPGTTYYWRFGVDFCQCEGAYGSTPVMSFTTQGTNAVETSTWGAIKTLFN